MERRRTKGDEMQVVIKNLDKEEGEDTIAVAFNIPLPSVGESVDISYNDGGIGLLLSVVKVVHSVKVFSVASLDASHESVTVWCVERDRKGRADNL